MESAKAVNEEQCKCTFNMNFIWFLLCSNYFTKRREKPRNVLKRQIPKTQKHPESEGMAGNVMHKIETEENLALLLTMYSTKLHTHTEEAEVERERGEGEWLWNLKRENYLVSGIWSVLTVAIAPTNNIITITTEHSPTHFLDAAIVSPSLSIWGYV